MAITFKEAVNKLRWRNEVLLDRFTMLRQRGNRSVDCTYRKSTVFVLNSENSYTLVTNAGNSLSALRKAATVKRQNLYTPAKVRLIDGHFAIQMRAGRGDFVKILESLVTVDNYGNITEPMEDLSYNCFVPKKAKLDCLKDKEDVLSAIVNGGDGEVIFTPPELRGHGDGVFLPTAFHVEVAS